MDLSDQPASVVILAKDAKLAKRRLGLPPSMAESLARALAVATLETALEAKSVGSVLVVTGDAAIAREAVRRGATAVREPHATGMNRAGAAGRAHLRNQSLAGPIAVMVADLPRLRSSDLDALAREYAVRRTPLFVSDHDGTGTTVVIDHPESTRPLAFGPGSARMHSCLGYQAAREEVHGLRFDLDTPTDLINASATFAPRCGPREDASFSLALELMAASPFVRSPGVPRQGVDRILLG